MKILGKSQILLYLPAFAASAVLLTVIQAPIGLWPLAWVAYVPLILVSSPAAKPRALFAAGYVVSLFYWLGNLYWMAPVTLPGWIAFCLYTALLLPTAAIALRRCRIWRVPLVLAVPILVVGAERLQGLFLGGFFWRHLAHSQYANITLIQIADIFGASGVSFLVAMVNALAAELIIARSEKNLLKIRHTAAIVVVCAAMVGAFLYGRWRIAQSDNFAEAGPLVGSVQSNIPQSVKTGGESSNVIFADLMNRSRAAAAAGAELIVWPETMVQAILNRDIWPFLVSTRENRAFDKAISEHAEETAYLLVGAYGGKIKQGPDLKGYLARYNSAFLYGPDGGQRPRSYNKIHLVPFGEVVPFKKSAPWLYNILMKFTPYEHDYSLDYGSEYTVFEMTGGKAASEKIYRFGTMICYEDAIPSIARNFALDKEGQKRLDWLINISNDGWFVRFNGEKVHPSTELAEHTAICVFRAVENRLGILRSVNTGVSCLIDPTGRIQDGFVAGNLPKQAMKRQGMAGWFIAQMPIDKRITFFTKYGQWLDFSCAVCFVSVIIGLLSAGYVRRRKNASVSRVQPNES